MKKQFTQLGSYLEVSDPKNVLAEEGPITLMAYVWPTLSQNGRRQTIMGRWDTLRNKGYALGINPSGNLEFWVGDGQEVDYVSGELPILPHVWYFVAASYDPKTGRATGVVFVDRKTAKASATDLVAVEPILVAEILSPSSYGRDFVDKLADYQGIPSLVYYLILSHEEPRVWLAARGGEACAQVQPL